MTRTPPRSVRRVVSLLLLGTSAVALAATSPLIISIGFSSGITTSSAGATLSVSTDAMPKGWFNNGNSLDRTKTDLRIEYAFGATTCSPAAALSTSSLTSGSFSPQTSGGSAVSGWFWDGEVDLTAYQNHWYRHLHCDGTVEVHGCAADVTVTATATAYAASGACREYVDGAGVSRCASSTQVATLPAVQDPDVVELCPAGEEGCGIGQCESACQAECGAATYSGTPKQQHDQRQQCRNGCECACKLQVRAGTSCHIEPKCLE